MSDHDSSSGAMQGKGAEMSETSKSSSSVEPGPGVAAPKTAEKLRDQDSWGEFIKTIIYALLIAGVIRTFLYQPFNIPSGSMENTLLIGDYLFVSKMSYGYSRYSFPFGLGPFSGRILAKEPQRGDVVVFKMPNSASPDYHKDYIKRLIGLPGDRIQMKEGQLYLNGKAVADQRVADYVEDLGGGYKNNVARYRETLPNGVSYYILDRTPVGNLDNTGVFVVPKGYYFMMGDNRDNSDDSRADVGYVPFDNLVGKAQIVFFSVDDSAHIWEIWKWPLAIRYGRFGELIH
jgi:signal peptidase I